MDKQIDDEKNKYKNINDINEIVDKIKKAMEDSTPEEHSIYLDMIKIATRELKTQNIENLNSDIILFKEKRRHICNIN